MDLLERKRRVGPNPLAKALGLVIGVGLTALFVCLIVAACFMTLRYGGVIE